jgi:hypothetical protein
MRYETYLNAFEALLEKLDAGPDWTVDVVGDFSRASEIYGEPPRDDYTGERSPSGAPTGPLDSEKKRAQQRAEKRRKAAETHDLVVREFRPQLLRLAAKAQDLMPFKKFARSSLDRSRLILGLAQKVIYDVALNYDLWPTSKQLTEIYAGAVGAYAWGDYTRDEIVRRFNLTKPTLRQWAEIMEEYDFLQKQPLGA